MGKNQKDVPGAIGCLLFFYGIPLGHAILVLITAAQAPERAKELFAAPYRWLWSWWRWEFQDPVISFFVTLILGVLSVAGTVLLVFWTVLSIISLIAIMILAWLAGLWVKLFDVSPAGAVVAVAIPLGALVFVLTRAPVRRWLESAFVALLPRRRSARKVEVFMPDDSLQDEERRLARRLASLPQLIPGAGPVPASPQEWAGYVENIRQRVQVRAQTKTNEAVLAHLKVINGCYAELLNYQLHVRELIHLGQREKIQDLQRNVEQRELEMQIKRLELEEEQLEVRRQALRDAQKPKPPAPKPATLGERAIRELLETAESLAMLESQKRKLLANEADPAMRDMIERIVENQRIRILESR